MAIANTSEHAAELLFMAIADSKTFGTFLRGAHDAQPHVALSQHGSFAREPDMKTDSTHTDSLTPKI